MNDATPTCGWNESAPSFPVTTNHLTSGNSEMATAVGAGINLAWDWKEYSGLMAGEKPELSCPVCERQKSREQMVCAVCYTNILDSRNGAYPDRYTKVEKPSTCQTV